jgi:precorrin-6y C5,15-methyltransferase (decarboxylating) CbiE subunit
MGDATRVTVVGCGPGGPDYVTPAARRAAGQADVLFGAERLLDLFPEARAVKVPVTAPLDEVLDEMESRARAGRRVCVLVSGDPGVHSLARLVLDRFGRANCRVLPGISSVQAAFASLGLSWENVRLESAHHRPPKTEVSEVAREDRIAVLLGSDAGRAWTVRLVRAASDHRCFVCENITLPDERVTEVTADELAAGEFSGRTVVLIVKEDLSE